MTHYNIKACSLCESDNLRHFQEIIKSPLANNLFDSAFDSCRAFRYPLGLSQCLKCNHIQLSFSVDASQLFTNYAYKSGLSKAFRSHFENYANIVTKKYMNVFEQRQVRVLDIGCNDGFLLDCFSELGIEETYGVDPAKNLTQELNQNHKIITDFFGLGMSASNNFENLFSIITANNVFAHTRNLADFAKAVSYSLKDNGVFVFEVQYLKSMIENNLFDMIYHEHTSYHHLTPLVNILPNYGLNVVDAEIVETHGGSLRVFCSNSTQDISIRMKDILAEEDRFFGSIELTTYVLSDFYTNINQTIKQFIDVIQNHINQGYSIWGYTAPAKATTWLSCLPDEVIKSFDFIIDDAALKQDKFLPGTQIPIKSLKSIQNNEREFLSDSQFNQFTQKSLGVIFSWNILQSLLQNLKSNSVGSSKYLTPLPEVKILTT